MAEQLVTYITVQFWGPTSLEGLGSRLVTDQGWLLLYHLYINHFHYPPPPPSSLPQSLISTWGNRLWRRDSSTDGSIFQSLPGLCVTPPSHSLHTVGSFQYYHFCTSVSVSAESVREKWKWVWLEVWPWCQVAESKVKLRPRVPIPNFY